MPVVALLLFELARAHRRQRYDVRHARLISSKLRFRFYCPTRASTCRESRGCPSFPLGVIVSLDVQMARRGCGNSTFCTAEPWIIVTFAVFLIGFTITMHYFLSTKKLLSAPFFFSLNKVISAKYAKNFQIRHYRTFNFMLVIMRWAEMN